MTVYESVPIKVPYSQQPATEEESEASESTVEDEMPVVAKKNEKPSWLGAWVGELQGFPPTHTVKPK